MTIAFYFNIDNVQHLDCTRLLEGNPGVGGTEYEILLVSLLLGRRDNGMEVHLLSRGEVNLPHTHHAVVGDHAGLCRYCREHGIDTLVVNQSQYNDDTMRIFDGCAGWLSLILWDHNGMSDKKLSVVNRKTYIKRIVCCGREMLELYRDHPATLKSTYVYNIFPIQPEEWYRRHIQMDDNHNVVYMGMLYRVKGFHVLARAWKEVLRQVPDAQLYVIGSGKLYDKNAVLGSHGIASQEFEDEIMPCLEDEAGNLLPSVHFCGLLGAEKFDVMGRCKVAVPNPWGESETFCICGIEMQLMGCNLTTVYHPAYLDTVYNQAYLYRHTSQLADYIVSRLKAPRDSYDDLYRFITGKFGMEKSLQRWEHLLSHLDQPLQLEPVSDKSYQIKWLKNALLHTKKHLPFLAALPCVHRFYDFRARVVRKIGKIM